MLCHFAEESKLEKFIHLCINQLGVISVIKAFSLLTGRFSAQLNLILPLGIKKCEMYMSVYYIIRENPSGFLVVPGESEFQKKIIIRSDL